MPVGVIFIVHIPSSNYEHILRFGKPKELLSIEDTNKKCHLEVELRNKKSRSIPVHLTQNVYDDNYNPTLENINENDEFIAMESVSIKVTMTFKMCGLTGKFRFETEV